MRGHSLVELTEHDDSAANIIVHCYDDIHGVHIISQGRMTAP